MRTLGAVLAVLALLTAFALAGWVGFLAIQREDRVEAVK